MDFARIISFKDEAARMEIGKASGPAPVPLINPTDADAERLQALWNEEVRARYARKRAEDRFAYIPFGAGPRISSPLAVMSAARRGASRRGR